MARRLPSAEATLTLPMVVCKPLATTPLTGAIGQGDLHAEAVLPWLNGRTDVGPNGMAFVYNQDCDYQIYETVIPIDPSLARVPIISIDFTGAPDAFYSNIFGISGQ
jgi:hypothetical protein